MSAHESTQAFLDNLPRELAESPEAAVALAMARELDDPNSATSKSMCARAHLEVMVRLRAMAPEEETGDAVDDIKAQRAKRLARVSAAAD